MAGKKRILIVEDDEVNIRILTKILAPTYDVSAVTDGAQALRLLEKDPVPDLVIADVMMPNLDGLGLLRAMKGHPRTKAVPVILVTAKSAPRDIIDGINAGARHYITKPFKMEDILQKVRKILV